MVLRNIMYVLQRGFLINSHRYVSRIANSFTSRSHTCGELNASHIEQEVTLCGWMTFHRCDKFIILRDAYGDTQVLLKEDDLSTKKYIATLPAESVLLVKGVVKSRPRKDWNKKLLTGEIEVEASNVKLLNICDSKLPINSKGIDKVTDTINYRYRYLSIRNSRIQSNLRLRSKILMKMREFLSNHEFVEIETPTLFKRTPGGAKEFVVPTSFPGKFYSLTQSPQQFKQLLMVGMLDRYFQIARCYRNEGTKSDRQPEFTQVDIELSFTTVKDVQTLIEGLIKFSFPPDKGIVKVPFPCMKYHDAMRLYGTDKPDLRYGMMLQDLTTDLKDSGFNIAAQSNTDPDFITSCIIIPSGSKFIKNAMIKDIRKLDESLPFFPVSIKDDLSWSASISKHVAVDLQRSISEKLSCSPGDLMLLVSGKSMRARTFLGRARVRCAEHLFSSGIDVFKQNEYSFLWVTDFPLFLCNGDGQLESAHHPFTAPHPDDVDLIYSNPADVRSLHYDLVLNGQEIGGGSIRIHDPHLQEYILNEVLKVDSTNLGHLLEAFKYGCPPHGGIALGADRLLAILCGSHSIVDVIAFPKSLDGKDLMSGAPCCLTEEEKLLYHIEPILPPK